MGLLPADFTRTITVPGSKKNNHFFEFVYDISVEDPYTFATNQKVDCYLDFDGIYLAAGYLQLNKVNVYQNKFIDSYEVTVYGGLASFGRDLKTFNLNDLDGLSKFNHTADIEHITNSWYGNLFSGSIVYPMAEYGQKLIYTPSDNNTGIDSRAGAMCVQDYKPAIKVKDVFDEVFTKFGYTYSSSFMNEPIWDDMYMLCNYANRYPIFPSSSYGLTDFNIETYGLYKIAAISGSGTNINLPLDTSNPLPFYNIEQNPSNFISSSLEFSYPFRTNIRGNINLNFQIAPTGSKDITYGYGVPQFKLLIEEFVTSAWVIISDIPLTNINQYMQEINTYNNGDTKTQTFTLLQPFTTTGYTAPNNNLPANYKLRWRLLVEPLVPGVNHFTVTLDPGDTAKSYLEITKTNQAGDGLTMDIPSNMPYGTSGILLIDFLSSIQKKFNLIIYPSKTKLYEFIIEPFSTWYKRGQIKNFNRYINLNSSITAEPANNMAVQYLNFGDTLDGDYVSQQFAKAANREFGKAYYVDYDNYFSQGTYEVKTKFASSPLTYLQGTGISGSAEITSSCPTCNTSGSYCYQINYGGTGPASSSVAYYKNCNNVSASQWMGGGVNNAWICAQYDSVKLAGSNISWTLLGPCLATGSAVTSSVVGNRMFIPTFISSVDYKPVKTLPHIYFYNGLKNCQNYWIEGYNTYVLSRPTVAAQFNAFPYVDYYSGSVPAVNSKSLLFYNEPTPYGDTPTGSLYSEYWEDYVNLLYNPRTRLFNASAIIPLADYFQMNLNDIVEWRGNYYHLRAINDYNLSNGECTIQLLGPVLKNTMTNVLPFDKCTFNFEITDGPTTTSSLWDLYSCTSSVSYSAISFNTTSSLQTGSVIKWDGANGCYTLSTSSAATASISGAIVLNIYNDCATCSGSMPICNCFYYNTVITSGDIEAATGNTTPNWNNTVWLRYYDCNTGAPLDTYFNAADNYYHAVCSNSSSGTPYLYYHINNSATTEGLTSTLAITTDNCCAEICDISCSSNVYVTHTGNDYYAYPTQSICSNVSSSFYLDWVTYQRPNRISVYDANGLVVSTGWKGDVDYPGPWGLDLHTATTGITYGTFTTVSGRYLLIEAGGGGGEYNDDACSVTLNCG